MGHATTLLVRSKYFLPVFNMAIFDGPFRLYFAQAQESEALRMYFELHEVIGEKITPPRAGSRNTKGLFVLLYPDEEAFRDSFGHSEPHGVTHIGDQMVVGVRGGVWEASALEFVISSIQALFNELDSEPQKEIAIESHY